MSPSSPSAPRSDATLGNAASVLARRLLLVTGKGGIGKSLVAASLGQLAAESGLRTLIVESASLDQLAPLFGGQPTGHAITPVSANPLLATINLNPSDNFRDYVVKHLGQKALFEKVFSHRVVHSFIDTIPGLPELMLLGRLYYECELAPAPRFDLVIFDGFASGHFLSLMTTPDAVLSSNLGGPLARETERVREFLADAAKVGILHVSVPEDLVVSETLDFLPALRAKAPAQLAGIIVNRVPEMPVGSGTPATDYLKGRAETSRQALASLTSGLAALDLRLPVWRLAELGFVDEPLPTGFGRRFLAPLVDAPGGEGRVTP